MDGVSTGWTELSTAAVGGELIGADPISLVVGTAVAGSDVKVVLPVRIGFVAEAVSSEASVPVADADAVVSEASVPVADTEAVVSRACEG